MDTQREAFEAWWRQVDELPADLTAWSAWQAALAATSAEPIYQIRPSGTAWFDRSKESYDECVAEGYESRIVYAAPLTHVAAIVPDAAQNFACFLIDRCEGKTITEESLLVWLVEFINEPRYVNAPASPADDSKTVPRESDAAPERTHTTQPGESVMGIALRQCGNEAEWRHILACNPQFTDMLPHEYFPVGTVLQLPPADDTGVVKGEADHG